MGAGASRGLQNRLRGAAEASRVSSILIHPRQIRALVGVMTAKLTAKARRRLGKPCGVGAGVFGRGACLNAQLTVRSRTGVRRAARGSGVHVDPSRVRQARLAAGLSLADLAGKD